MPFGALVESLLALGGLGLFLRRRKRRSAKEAVQQ